MISKETLDAVNVGMLTDDQLKEAIKHYKELSDNLKCHGTLYYLTWSDAYRNLLTLEGMEDSRKQK